MRLFILFLFVLISINFYSQCSGYSVTATYTPPTCSVCCDGAITPSVTIPGFPCAPTSCYTLQPLGLIGCNTWNNLCAGSYTIAFQDGCCYGVCGVILPAGPTSVDNQEHNSDILVFPNPASNLLYILYEGNIGLNNRISIKNTLGRIVLNTEFKNEIDVSELSAGVYLLQIQNSKKQLVQRKLIITK